MASNKILHDNDYLDFNKIEAEVKNAVVSEEKYWRENDAKIRAVEQRVPTYEDFREMVLAAHLKPLENKDKISSIGKFTQVWNQLAMKWETCPSKKEEINSNKQDNEQAEGSTPVKSSVMKLPKTRTDFILHWKHYCKTAETKKQFLLTIGSKEVAKIFKTEIGDLLGEFLECLQCLENSEAAQAVELLEELTQSQRFSISLAFLSKKQLESCKLVFDKLKDCPYVKESQGLAEIVAKLEGIYCK